MGLTDFSKICRACLTHSESRKPVFSMEEVMNQQIIISDMLMTCTSVTILKNDGLPDSICFNCLEDIRRAFSFKKMCESSDQTLRNCTNIIHTVHSTFNQEVKDIKATPAVNTNLIENQVSSWNNEKQHCDVLIADNEASSEIKKEIIAKAEGMRRKKKSYNCEECSEECLGLAAYWKHMASVHEKNLKCDICGKEFKTQNLLKQHKISHHHEKASLNHTKTKTGIKKKRNLPRTCDICNKTFRFHSNLERHKLIHTGEKPYLCNVCGKGFGQMSYLKIHSFIHTGEKPYKCQMCDKSFAAPGTLMTHTRIHTGERPHVCKICGKDFPQSGYLSAHIRTHTGEKPVECKVCHRRFNQSGRLVIHMRIHSGEKPYTCKECGRSFAVRGTLKKHIRTHTGERPYVCSVCGQAFAQSGTLATHMKVHKPKQ